MTTTITISDDLWKVINKERINPQETMEDVIWRWCNIADEKINIKKKEEDSYSHGFKHF